MCKQIIIIANYYYCNYYNNKHIIAGDRNDDYHY